MIRIPFLALLLAAAPAVAQTLPLSQSSTFKTPTFTGTATVTNSGEGSIKVESSHDNSSSGYVSLFSPSGTRLGYVGFANSFGLNIVSESGSVYLKPKGPTGNFLRVGQDSNGNLIVNVNGLPTSCTGQSAGTMYASSGFVKYC